MALCLFKLRQVLNGVKDHLSATGVAFVALGVGELWVALTCFARTRTALVEHTGSMRVAVRYRARSHTFAFVYVYS